MVEQFDLAVIGGGPAGATVAGLMAREGYRVLVAEREKFPRYSVGESLVPGIHPIMQDLGLYEEAQSRGFVFKPGLSIRWGPHRPALNVFFGDTGLYEGVYQVVRAEFDQMLLQNARRLGATVLEDTRVVDVLFEGDRCTGFSYLSPEGGDRVTVQARYVVDASGQSAILARRLGLLEFDDRLKNVAIWTYFQNALPFEGRLAGNTLMENMSDGWLWVIPLHDGTTSVGWVAPASQARGRKQLEATFREKIAASVETRRVLAPARQVAGFRTTRDWSYTTRRSSGPGYLLAGDSAGFVDPIYSTGVFIAMAAGRLAAMALTRAFKESDREAEIFQAYDDTYKEFLGDIFSIVHHFYESSADTDTYWSQDPSRDPLHRMATRPDFGTLISGLQGVRTVLSFERGGLERLLDECDDPRTPQDLFDELAKTLTAQPGRSEGLNATYQFDIVGENGGQWYVAVRNGTAKVGKGVAENPSCVITLSEPAWKAVASGRVSGNAAFMLGRMKVDGEIRIAAQTARLFGGRGPAFSRSAPVSEPVPA